MAKKLGYGGIANTNGARTFSGKTEASAPANPKAAFGRVPIKRTPAWTTERK